jgi:hypothetical protein
MSIAKLLTKNKLENALKPLTFEPNSIDGWGPTKNPRNKIMKVNFDFGKTFTIDTSSKIKRVVEQLTKSITDINSRLQFIENTYVIRLDALLNQVNFQYQVFDQFSRLVDFTGAPQGDIPNIGLWRPIIDPFILDIFTIPQTNFTARELFSNEDFNLITEEITSYDINGNPTVESFVDRFIRIPNNFNLALNPVTNNRANIIQYQELQGNNNRERNNVRRLLNETNNNVAFIAALDAGVIVLNEINNGIFYTRKIKIILNQVRELIKEMQIINTSLNTEFSKNYMNIPYDVILNNCLRLQ